MESRTIYPNAHITSMRPKNTDMWLWKISLSAVAEYMYKTYKRWWLSIKTSGGGYQSFEFLNYTELRLLNSEIDDFFS